MLTGTVSKPFSIQSREKSWVGSYSMTFLKENGEQNELISFSVHGFNLLFGVAGSKY